MNAESPSRCVDLTTRGVPLIPYTDIEILKDHIKHELKDDLSKVVCEVVGNTLKCMLGNVPELQTTQKARAKGGVHRDDDDSGIDADTEDDDSRVKPKKMKGHPERRSAAKNEFVVGVLVLISMTWF